LDRPLPASVYESELLRPYCYQRYKNGDVEVQLTNARLEPSRGELEWEQILRDIFRWRSAARDQVWRVCAEGAHLLAYFHNFMMDQLAATTAQRVLDGARMDGTGLENDGVTLYLLSGQSDLVIGTETAWNALLLCAWYLGRQVRLLPGHRIKPVSKDVSKEDLMETIRSKGHVTDAQLLHSFHRLSASARDRMLKELADEGRVRRDDPPEASYFAKIPRSLSFQVVL